MSNKKPVTSTTDLNPELVLRYLEEHPDFTEKALQQLELPTHSTSHGTISFSGRKLTSVNKKLAETESKLAELIQNSTDNSHLFECCHRLILALLDTSNTTSFITALTKSLENDFKFSNHQLFIFADQPAPINEHASFIKRKTLEQQLGGIVSSQQPTLGILRQQEMRLLFPDNHLTIASAAVLPINDKQPIALLTLGSADQNNFRAGLETTFIKLITDVLSRLIPARVTPPDSILGRAE
ncbi:MAG TPA: DUF484 family protein [Gammaproteobacteria bacterium]|nr:DUF484 family protein [Gammaproteobacteria bacterium]HIK69320.1 DUF484 family protein [Pseudomonadales bacterium]